MVGSIPASGDDKGKLMDAKKCDAFIKDIIEVYRKHGLGISHEDSHGAFIIEELNQDLIDWIEWAFNGPKREIKNDK